MPLIGLGGPGARAAELDALASEPYEHPTVIVGDFNTVPWSPVLLQLTEERNLRRLNIGARTTWLSPLLFLGLPIDHALVSEAMMASAEVGPHIRSDHRPLIIRVKLPATTETPQTL